MKRILVTGFILAGVLFLSSLGSSEEAKENLISLDFREIEISDALRLLAKQHSLNIILSKDVTGIISVQFSNVTVEEAIDALVTTNGFAYTKLENVYKVTKPDAAQPSTRIFLLNNATAKEVKSALQKVLSSVGNIDVDERSNSILVTDLPSVMATIEKLLKDLDSITPQVMIESKVIETVLGSTDKLGIDWTIKATAVGAKRPTTLPFDPLKSSGMEDFLPQSKPTASGTVGDFPSVGTGPPLAGEPYSFPYAIKGDFALGTLNFSEFQAVLELLKTRSKTNLLSAPRITTLNNREAKVVVGTKIPIPLYERNETTGTMEVTGYEEQDIGISLRVTPNVSPDGMIRLTLHPEVSSILSYTGPNNERPIVSTREADTQVQLKDGETVVIGGLIKEQNVDTLKRVPVLGYIPVLDFFFKKSEVTKEKTDLLIFVTAHIFSDKKKDKATYTAMVDTQSRDLSTELFKEELKDYAEQMTKPLKSTKQIAKEALAKKRESKKTYKPAK